MGALDDAPVITVHSRADLRAWLAAHHAEKGPAWLACYRPHHPDFLGPLDSTEELLCWGWINSVPRALDGDRSMVLIAPRKVTSAWSAVNKALVDKARASGAMTPAGEAKITAAQTNGMWSFLDDVEALLVPDDLSARLGSTAAEVWAGYPRTVKRGTLEWLKMAKGTETRAARIDEIATSAEAGLRPKIFRR